jgi:hypothetical protein
MNRVIVFKSWAKTLAAKCMGKDGCEPREMLLY